MPMIMVIMRKKDCGEGEGHSDCTGDILGTLFNDIDDMVSECCAWNETERQWENPPDEIVGSVVLMAKHIAGDDRYFLISKDRWNRESLAGIKSLFGETPAALVSDLAAVHGWEDLREEE